MASNVIDKRQVIEVDEVEAIDVTDVADASDGSKVRELRVYGSPEGRDAPPIVTVRVKASNPDPIKITTPKLDY